MLTLGFDTSNYTTSVAAFDGVGGEKLLTPFGREARRTRTAAV